MTNIIKRNSSNMPATFGGLVDNVFRNGLSRFFDDDWGFNGMLTRNQVPVNIRETDTTYEMEVVAPGLKKEDFTVNITKDLLTVSFEHKEENRDENNQDGYLRSEYRMQSFSRSFSIDDTVDANNINARYADGILHVTLPKKEGAQNISKPIEVK